MWFRRFMVGMSIITLLVAGFNPFNARFSEWMFAIIIIYGSFVIMLWLELLFRTTGSLLFGLGLPVLALFVPFAAIPYSQAFVMSTFPPGELVTVDDPSEFIPIVWNDQRGTIVTVRNTSDDLIENIMLRCQIRTSDGQELSEFRYRIKSWSGEWVKPGENAEGMILSASQYELPKRKGSDPNATTCGVDFISLVKN